MALEYPTKLEAALLYDRKTAVDLDRVLARFNAAIADTGIAFAATVSLAGGHTRIFNHGDFYFIISQDPQPLDRRGFLGAAKSTFVQITMLDALEAVVEHKANLFITLSIGLPIPDTVANSSPNRKVVADLIRPPATTQDHEIFMLLARLLMDMLREVCSEDLPRAVHWLQSDQLFLGEIAHKLCNGLGLINLMYRPDISMGNDINGQPVLGLRTFGARHLIGCEVEFHAAPIQFEDIVTLTNAFVAMSMKGIIPDGDTFGTEDLRIRVTYGPERSLPGGGLVRLQLEYRKDPPFGKPWPDNKPPAGVEIVSHEDDDENEPAFIDRLDLNRKTVERASANLVRDMRSRLAQQTRPEPKPAGKSLFGKLRSAFDTLH